MISLLTFRFNCLGDSFLKTAITLLSDFPKLIELEGKPVSSEKYLYESISNMISTLVAVPVRRKIFERQRNFRFLLNILGQSRSRSSLFSQWFGQCNNVDEMLGRNKRITSFTLNQFTLLFFNPSSNVFTLSHSERLTNSFNERKLVVENRNFFHFSRSKWRSLWKRSRFCHRSSSTHRSTLWSNCSNFKRFRKHSKSFLHKMKTFDLLFLECQTTINVSFRIFQSNYCSRRFKSNKMFKIRDESLEFVSKKCNARKSKICRKIFDNENNRKQKMTFFSFV